MITNETLAQAIHSLLSGKKPDLTKEQRDEIEAVAKAEAIRQEEEQREMLRRKEKEARDKVRRARDKYELEDGEDPRGLDGTKPRRIRALRAIPRHGVKEGDLGGMIVNGCNLSQDGDCWIDKDAKVLGADAQVKGNALVDAGSTIHAGAVVSDTARVYGAKVTGATIDGHAILARIDADGPAHIKDCVIMRHAGVYNYPLPEFASGEYVGEFVVCLPSGNFTKRNPDLDYYELAKKGEMLKH